MVSERLELSPYRGLAAFGESDLDSQLFFGRDRETEIVAANLQASRLTVLYGASGVGKSSLLRAGVAHHLRRAAAGGANHVVVVCSGWRDDPIATLSAATEVAVRETVGYLPELEDELSFPDRLEVWTRSFDGEIYLVLDQVEEYLLYHGADGGGPLAGALADIVTRPSLRVGVLLGIRDDALAQLDTLKARIPGLFGNLLRLDHLTRDEGRHAIVGPLAELTLRGQPSSEAEPELVETVLDQVTAGKIAVTEGRGVVAEREHGGRIEAPFLQLVMERLWDVERERGSSTLHAATLAELGGAARIVEEHLESALGELTSEGRDTAAAVFGFLVTPSGTKIAHSSADLARYTGISEAELDRALEHLAALRVLRPVGGGADGERRFEIFHDVLAGAVLGWSVRHEGERELERTRDDARRRNRRLGGVAAIALAGLALMSALTVWAFSERNTAQEQTAAANAAEAEAMQQTEIARKAEKRATQQAAAAQSAREEAETQSAAAKAAQRDAEQQAEVAAAAQTDAQKQAEIARQEAERADDQAAIAGKARTRAETEAENARRAKLASQRDAVRAERQKRSAQDQTLVARANERAAMAMQLLSSDPELSLAASLEALALMPTVPVEGALRSGLMTSRVSDILPGGQGAVVASFADAMAATPPSRLASRNEVAQHGVVTVTERGTIRVFDRATGALVRSVEHGSRVNTAKVSPDHRLLAVAGPLGEVTTYALASGTRLGVARHVGAVTSLAFSPDGQLLASAGVNETAKVWRVDRMELVHRFDHPRSVRKVAFSPDGLKLLTVSNDPIARLFDLSTGNLVQTFDQGSVLTDVALSPNGQLVVTTGNDGTPQLWDVASGRLVFPLRGHTGIVLTAAFSPGGDRIVTSGTDGAARTWSTATGQMESVLVGHSNFVEIASFSPDGQHVLTASRDRTARVWNAVTGAAQAQLLGHDGRLVAASFDRGGLGALTSSEDGTSRTWELRLEDPSSRLLGETESSVTDLAASRDGRFVADAHADGEVDVRDLAGKMIASVLHGGPGTSVAFSGSGGELLTSGSDGTARLWALPSGRPIASFDHGAPIAKAVMTPSGGVLTAGQDGVVRQWDSRTSPAQVLMLEQGPISDLSLSSDGTLIATAVGNVIRISAVNGRSRRVLTGHRDTVTSAAFSPDGRYVVSASRDHDVILWSAKTGKPLRTFAGHVALVRGAEFSPDGRWIASAGPTRAGIWERNKSPLVDGRLLYLAGHQGGLTAVTFVGDRWRLVTGGLDGDVRVFDCRLCATSPTLAKIAAKKLARLDRDAGR